MSLSWAAQHVCLCYIPSKQCFEEMRFFKEAQVSLQSIHVNQKMLSFISWWLLLS
jgi:hypothetical protein